MDRLTLRVDVADFDRERVKELLDEALDLPPTERDPHLESACGGDGALLTEVRELLAAYGEESGRLDRSPVLELLHDEAPLGEEVLEGLVGLQVGAYQLVRLIGEGGMGVVYEATRQDGRYEQRVAIKLVKGGVASGWIARRFRQERQILARLSHPNIAVFLDAGVTHELYPYLVMELVEGDRITRYCDDGRLSIDARIKLFLQVCDAVHFAHQNLIVHRDLKPGNIMVSPSGRVKLLDFGVAKLLTGESNPDVTLTRQGGRVLTPSYSSPEQVRGEPVTTATDVYSLGVILYELLAQRKPFDLEHASLPEVLRVVSDVEPSKPSRTSADDSPASRRLGRKLSGDLDKIVLKAMHKDPVRRYTSAKELSDDLCRYLDGHPVTAQRDTLAYRARKFAGRYRAAVVGTAAVLVALTAGSLATWRQAQRAHAQELLAQQRVDDVRTLTNALLFDVHDAVADLPGSTAVRKLILDHAYERLESVQADLPDDPQLLWELSGAYRRLGEVQGRPTGASLGDLSRARRSYEQGISLAERSLAIDDSDLERTRSLGLLQERLGDVLSFMGETEAGVEQAKKALQIYQRLADLHPDSVRHQLTVTIGQIKVSDLSGHPSFPNLGLTDDAEAGYRAAEARLGAPPLVDSDSYGVRRYRGLVMERLARMLRIRNEHEEARAAYLASLDARESLLADHPAEEELRRDVVVTHQNLCVVNRMTGRMREAREACDLALAGYRARFIADSVNASTLADLAEAHRSMEELSLAEGDTTTALEHLAQVRYWSGRQLAIDSTNLKARSVLLDALLTEGLIEARNTGGYARWNQVKSLAEALRREGHLEPSDGDRLALLDERIAS